MKKNISTWAFVALASFVIVPQAKASVGDRLFDFTDTFYRANGVDPSLVTGRASADGIRFVTSTPLFSYQRNVRALFTLGEWRDNGSPVFYTVLGGFNAAAFTQNAAGQRARQVADASAEYIFPKRGTNPTALNNVRQPFMLDLSNGYFSNNPLNLWIHTFVNFTDKAFNTSDGRKALQDLAGKYGLALDGTPNIKSKSDIENLFQKGYVTKTTMPLDSTLRYAICPVIKDPRDGGIAMDQFLVTTRNPDGTAVDPLIQRTFDSLRLNGVSSTSP